MSTDENYLGALTEKQQLQAQSPARVSSMCKKFRKFSQKSAIGPRNLEMKQCDKSSGALGYPDSSSSHLDKILGGQDTSIPSQKSSIYRRKYRFMKEISDVGK